MPTPALSPRKIKQLIILATCSQFSKTHIARHLQISRSTLRKYLSAFQCTSLAPSQIEHLTVFEVKSHFIRHQCTSTRTDRYRTLDKQLPLVHLRLQTETIALRDLWREYSASSFGRYSYSTFCCRYNKWRETHSLPKPSKNARYICEIGQSDLDILKEWRLSSNRRLWERASALEALSRGESLVHLCGKLERSRKSIIQWIQLYRTKGLSALSVPRTKAISLASLRTIKEREERLLKLIHEPPNVHDVNRASWSLGSLAQAYKTEYGTSVSRTTISDFFKKVGYRFRKAKKVLTSSDPDFRAKLGLIKQTLAELKRNEKFFSIDEFGPFSIKLRGGLALVPGDAVRTIPQRQKSKGSLICAAALELSTNQLTHFYSTKKNTDEMIKLMMLLLQKYDQDKRIFLSWDSASWHMSKALYQKVDEVNSDQYRKEHSSPIVELRPLPSGAQFLNVIESVFSGMSRAILHNSNYQSVDTCKAAIDRYISDRNRFFLQNPKRAGNKIWGQERVATRFKDANLCKNPRWR
jgi:transposase